MEVWVPGTPCGVRGPSESAALAAGGLCGCDASSELLSRAPLQAWTREGTKTEMASWWLPCLPQEPSGALGWRGTGGSGHAPGAGPGPVLPAASHQLCSPAQRL